MGDLLAHKVLKRSVSIAGHSTSISLEQPFWVLLERIAAERNCSLPALIGEIDEARATNLSSALRLYVVGYLCEKSDLTKYSV